MTRFRIAHSESQEEQEDGYADPVVEAALDIEAFPDGAGYGLVCDHRLAQGRIRGRQHGGEQSDFKKAEFLEEERPHPEAENNRQRKPDQQESNRNRLDSPQCDQIRIRRIRKENQGEGEFCEGLQAFAPDLDIDPTHDLIATQESSQDVYQGTIETGLLETGGHNRVAEGECGNDGEV